MSSNMIMRPFFLVLIPFKNFNDSLIIPFYYFSVKRFIWSHKNKSLGRKIIWIFWKIHVLIVGFRHTCGHIFCFCCACAFNRSITDYTNRYNCYCYSGNGIANWKRSI